MKVLIIDDEVDICYLLSSLLKQKDLDTQYVNSLTAASKALDVVDPQIVFLDNHLPDGLGINFIEIIKTKKPHIKVVMITAHDSSTDRQNAISVGADFFIGKPFSKDIVYSTVEKLLN